MTATIDRPMAPGAVWSFRLGAFSAVLLATVLVAHRQRFVSTPDLVPLLGTTLAIALIGLAAGVVAHRRYWYFGDRGGRQIFWGGFWSLVTLAPFLVGAWWYLAYPKLSDISTDPENPPALAEAARLRTPDMNAIGDPTPASIIEQADAYPLVEGHRYELPMDRVLAAVESIVARRGWTVTGTRESVGAAYETTVEAVAYSPFWALPADVAIRVTDMGSAAFVDMRSASRYGAHDLGGNAAFILGFMEALDAAMAAQAGTVPVRAGPVEEEDEAPTVDIPDEAPPPTQAPAQ